MDGETAFENWQPSECVIRNSSVSECKQIETFKNQNMTSIYKLAMIKGLIFGFIFLLSSCGGGGGGGSSTTTFTGVAIDGNLYKAQVFLDLNDNGSYDSGEPTATTDASGSFTLTATQEQINSHLIIGLAIAGTTIDQDSPNSPLTS